MITIDLSSPSGNVFVLLGHAKNFQRQLEGAGIKGGNPHLKKVLAEYTKMKYDEICKELEASELFKFTNGDEEEEE